MASSQQHPLIYFHSLELENVCCFGERRVLKLTDDKGRLAQWTLLLGENDVGKTTLLQCLAWMRPVPRVTKNEGQPDAIEPALNSEENNVRHLTEEPLHVLQLLGTRHAGFYREKFTSIRPSGRNVSCTGAGAA